MQKKSFKIITKEDYDFIPANVIIIRDTEGWLFMAKAGTQWYTNATQDNKDGTEDEAKFIKKLVKALKLQLKDVKK